MANSTIKRYIWLLNILKQRHRLTFNEISNLWDRSSLNDDGKPLVLRTFHNHREGIDKLFGIKIECDISTNEYYISSNDDLRDDATNRWLYNSFAISNMIAAGHSMKDRILYEDIPGGVEFTQVVVEAMQQNMVLRIDYKRFGSQQFVVHLHPYAMKMYNHRWYVVGHREENNQLRVIALDRVIAMEITDRHFALPENFDAASYYANSVGIFVSESAQPQRVVVRAYGIHADYLRTLPLHHSQKEIAVKEWCCDFEYSLSLTPELTTQLLAMGEDIEVIMPEALRDEMRKKIIGMFSRY